MALGLEKGNIPHESIKTREVSSEQLQKTKHGIQKSQKLYNVNTTKEQQEKQEFLAYFNSNIDNIWLNSELNYKSQPNNNVNQNSLHKTEKYLPKSGSPEKTNEKEKLELNARLANLSYSEFRTVYESNTKTPKLEINDIMLDPLSFSNIARIFDKPKPNNLNKDEKFLCDYIEKENSNFNTSQIATDKLPGDIQDILKICHAGNQKNIYLAQNEEKYMSTISDINITNYGSFDSRIKPLNLTILVKGLMELKKIKIQENNKDFDLLKTKIEILDYFPNETKHDPEQSGFGAICTIDKITGKKIFVIRGTELTDWGDIVADGKLAFKKIPIEQVKNMIEFVERNITAGEQFDITGHSLGGALSQILTAIYLDNLQSNKENISNSQVYTFNAPGVKGLSVDLDGEKGQIFDKLNKFVYNNQRFETGELITRVTGAAGLNLITNLNEHMGNNEVRLTNLSSHSIEKTIQYIENEAKDIEFKRIRVRFKEENKEIPTI